MYTFPVIPPPIPINNDNSDPIIHLHPRPIDNHTIVHVHPRSDTELMTLIQRAYKLAVATGYEGDIIQFEQFFGAFIENNSELFIPYEKYMGQDIITPLPFLDQILQTAHTFVQENIVIEKIPYTEVSNTAGGTTVIIG